MNVVTAHCLSMHITIFTVQHSSHMFWSILSMAYLFFWRNLCRGPSAASSMTSMRFSASQMPIIRTMYGLSSCLHDARFPQHLVLHRFVIIIVLQDLNSDNLLCPESNIKEDPFWKLNVFKSCRKSYLRAECTWMAPLRGKLNTSAIHEEADQTTKQPNHISHNTWWQERKKYTTLTCLFV